MTDGHKSTGPMASGRGLVPRSRQSSYCPFRVTGVSTEDQATCHGTLPHRVHACVYIHVEAKS